ncbi:hypothetical protein [Halostella litorea]|uniref:hypothetical protein n=1 Tax=Halostella litorea TaxID=2528831 RepID=UPI0010933210|nr:hypothetical protein [Halostella litorea]
MDITREFTRTELAGLATVAATILVTSWLQTPVDGVSRAATALLAGSAALASATLGLRMIKRA